MLNKVAPLFGDVVMTFVWMHSRALCVVWLMLYGIFLFSFWIMPIPGGNLASIYFVNDFHKEFIFTYLEKSCNVGFC